jgi:hypothetical protein
MRTLRFAIVICLLAAPGLRLRAADPAIDVLNVRRDAEVTFAFDQEKVVVDWPAGPESAARAMFRLDSRAPLIESLELRTGSTDPSKVIARDLAPFAALTVGTRNLETPAGWTIFFDKVHERPYERHTAELSIERVTAAARGARGSLSFGPFKAGSFSGRLEFTFFAGSPLILAEAVLSTAENGRAILYDAGIVTPRTENAPKSDRAASCFERFVWSDFDDTFKSQAVHAASLAGPAGPRSVNYRAVAADFRDGGSLAVFPPPHQFFYPLDFAENFGFNWFGHNYESAPAGDGLGIRQPPEGDRRFTPWMNAPPGTAQRLGMFYLLSTEKAESALEAAKRYTRSDRYAPLPGYKTFTSHYHVEHTLDLLKRRADRPTAASAESTIPPDLVTPDFVRVFRRTGLDIVHLAEFHNGRTPKLETPERVTQLRTLHAECERLSDDKFLLVPGEEPNVHLGGHWISLFPKPVLWVLNRPKAEPFVSRNAAGETIYHVGGVDDVLELMRREQGLMWTAHARIKSSFGFPDNYHNTKFFRSPQFLGAAWKAMPADLSHDTLGRRVLDLLDDMNQWSPPKQAIGEVDVFQVRPGYEFYGHANVNYVRLDRVPKFTDGWLPLLEALRAGRFFTTTGEILITDFDLIGDPQAALSARARLRWTFPLRHAEIVAGDGKEVFRHRIELTDSRQFGERTFTFALPPEMAKCRWHRLEVWDVATNGAFTQPLHR